MARSVDAEHVFRLRIIPIQLALILVILASSVTAADALLSRDAAVRRFARWGLIAAAVTATGLALGTIWSLRQLVRTQVRARDERERTERRHRALICSTNELRDQLQRVSDTIERTRPVIAPEIASELEMQTARLETALRRVVDGAETHTRMQTQQVELDLLLGQVIAGAQPHAERLGRRLVAYLQRPLPALAVDAARLAAGLSIMIRQAVAEHADDEVIVRALMCEQGVRIEVDGATEPPVDLVVLVEAHGGVVGTLRVPHLSSWLLLPAEPAWLA
ncbi:MAG: hypothetical protein SFX73_27030 [Kofleriaceae bacterium]|nr:hypothetical protein [Kofleriaceae bacterium]